MEGPNRCGEGKLFLEGGTPPRMDPWVLGGLTATAVVTLALLARQGGYARPELGLAAGPWMVTGAFAHVLAGTPGYPDLLQPLFGMLAVYPATATAAGLVWFPFREVAVRQETVPSGTRLASGGIGAATALGGVLLVGPADVTVRGTLLLGAVPVVAAVVAILLGLAHHEVDSVGIGRTRGLGILVLFGHGVAALSWALLLRNGQSVGGPAGETITTAADALPGGPPTVVLATLAASLVAVSLLGRLTRRNEALGVLVGTALAAVGLGPGTEALLRAAELI